MRIALKFSYDGRNFYGFARQPGLKTIEGEILKILKETGYIIGPRESEFRYASRTDKGVSAVGNVIAFNTDKETNEIFDQINTNKDIIFYGIKKVDDDFYPRHAKKRIYRYYLKNDVYDIDKIIKTSSIFTGEHDFTNFARIEEGKKPVRKIDNIIICNESDYILIDFYAQTFLWNQIRRIISAIEKSTKGKISDEEIKDALDSPEKKVDFGVANAENLILLDVIYDFNFEIKKI